MTDTHDLVMTDHPAWTDAADGSGKLRVFVMPDGGRFLVRTAGSAVTLDNLSPAATKPVGEVFQLPADALTAVPELAASLASLGTVVRFRTGNLWEAIGTAIIAQTVRDGQAKKVYRALCHAHGERVELAAGEPSWLFPTPEQILDLTVDDYRSVDLRTKRTALQDAASVYQRQGERWHSLDPRTLVDPIRRLPRVGPWTAHVAITDWSNDWSLYPFSDLAVRTAARLAAPSGAWPTDERLFGSAWRMHAGPHLPLITVLTLAWGNRHAETT